jgi:tRNA-dihydrouridine synthase A
MLDWTDRHCRYFLRLISRHSWLYTEMITTGALLHGDVDYLLRIDRSEHPVALQLGGSEPADMARCAQLGAEFGYDEININVGCPSDRVQTGRFGACLMAEPQRVGDCVAAMAAAASLPITVKTRIGIDEQDSYEALHHFIATISAAGCRTVIVHARKAWLSGLSPKENRTIPPLRYDIVYQLKRDFPQLEIVINGGVEALGHAQSHVEQVDGVMIGREAYHNPYLLAQVDAVFYGDAHFVPSRAEIVESLLPYIERELAAGSPLKNMTRHILGLYHGVPGARAWRRYLSENSHRANAGTDVVRAALNAVTTAHPHVLTD